MSVAQWRADSKCITALAFPLILTQLSQVALSTTDIAMMGMLEPIDLAAGGLAVSIFGFLRSMGVGLVTPTGNMVAAASVGTIRPSSRESELRALLYSSFLMATIAGLFFWGLMLVAGTGLAWLGQNAGVAARAADYLVFVAPGIVPLLWFQTLRNFTIGLRRPGPLLLITLLAVAVNAALNFVLMFGYLGMPALGLIGIACSTTTVNFFSFFLFLTIIRRDKEMAPYLSWRQWHPRRADVIRLWRAGLPVAATYGSEAGFFLVLLLLVGSISADALAAHTIVNQAVYIVFMISVGISQATSICISRSWALKQVEQSASLAYTGLALGLVCMAVVGAIYLRWPHQVLSLFFSEGTDRMVLMSNALPLLMIAGMLQFFDCAQNIGIGILRGAGETRSSFVITLFGYWGIGFPIAWLLGKYFSFGASGIWVGLTLGLLMTAMQLLHRFRRILKSKRIAVSRGDFDYAN
ncbi:MATE family efflux transporter [Herbaspirillum sp. RTI4]|uniref:MATE family efflux transporter n=1 Tax=Herbaspirillum sp. RTI4 TaxID=3048640 RepID=UPI002AB3F179|nr:MATE family efflux transporter [Herbaspirillum sp. RTI4]MDY7579987.1 MATE family efflux transporter [Herbaspirillum sp. RTI4]MEA9982802.1 MATE family efflux transporter [Herbaspirillum sp. RTI4]